MASASKPANRTWIISLSAIGVVAAAAIIGVVSYGTVIKPAEDKAKNVTACTSFLNGNEKARLAYVAEATATDHEPNLETAIRNFLTEEFAGVNKAIMEAAPKTPIRLAIADIGVQQLKYDSGNGDLVTIFKSVDSSATALVTQCKAILPAPSVTVTPTH